MSQLTHLQVARSWITAVIIKQNNIAFFLVGILYPRSDFKSAILAIRKLKKRTAKSRSPAFAMFRNGYELYVSVCV